MSASTHAEANMALPGDELIPRADLTATRAVTVQAGADAVWSWIAQLVQGREFQDIAVGDDVTLAPQMGLAVAWLNPGRSLVLRGGIPIGTRPPPFDFTWAFTLRDEPDHTTRLLVRERYAYTRPWARLLVEPTEAVSFVMSQKMLRGIKHRAEQTAAVTSKPTRMNPRVRAQRSRRSDASAKSPT